MLNLTPEQIAINDARRAEHQRRVNDWIANNPDRVATCIQKAKENADKYFEERKIMEETDPNAYSELTASEPNYKKDPELYLLYQERTLIVEQMFEDEKNKRIADFENTVQELFNTLGNAR